MSRSTAGSTPPSRCGRRARPTIVTLVEEVTVVEKRLRAIGEVRITKRKSVRHAPQKITLRREEAVVERLTADGLKDDESQ